MRSAEYAGLPYNCAPGFKLISTYLCGDVGVVFAVSVTVVGVDVVRAGHVVCGLEHHARVVVSDHVGVTVLRLVHLQTRVVPRELLARLDTLKYSNYNKLLTQYQL